MAKFETNLNQERKFCMKSTKSAWRFAKPRKEPPDKSRGGRTSQIALAHSRRNSPPVSSFLATLVMLVAFLAGSVHATCDCALTTWDAPAEITGSPAYVKIEKTLFVTADMLAWTTAVPFYTANLDGTGGCIASDCDLTYATTLDLGGDYATSQSSDTEIAFQLVSGSHKGLNKMKVTMTPTNVANTGPAAYDAIWVFVYCDPVW